MSDKSNARRYKDGELRFHLFEEPGVLNTSALKDYFNKINWIYVPRQLSEKFKDFFYIGTYQDDDRVIRIKVRPTKQANITESLVDAVATSGGRGTANHGDYCCVKVEDSFLDKIKSVAKEMPRRKQQTLSWD
jgi:hypothetical protein